MSLSNTLKHATAEAHQRAESRDLQRQLIRGGLDERRLGQYLEQLRCIHAELERLFDLHEGAAGVIEWSNAYRHSQRLDQDLTELGMVPDDVEANAATHRLLHALECSVSREPIALLGYLYVLEGSMNGNRFIVRALRKTPAGSRCSFAYFDPYGDDQPNRWAAFKVALDAANLDSQRERIVVDAALCMFETIAQISDDVMSDDACGMARVAAPAEAALAAVVVSSTARCSVGASPK